jgi:metal-responsive CopG/Arc/MetJ family transcriptional regulator
VRVKTSVTLPDDLLQEIDNAGTNPSSFLERAVRKYLADLYQSRRDRRDAEILNAHADRLNREALDVLEYQDFG